MNAEFFLYKTRFTTIVLLLAYTWLHLKLTLIDGDLKPDDIPITSLIYNILNPAECLFLFEFVFAGLFFITLNALLRIEFKADEARLLSWLFFLILPLITVVNYGYTYHAKAAFFHSADTRALFLMSLGFLLCLQSRWFWYAGVVFLATLNSQSSILLVFLPIIHGPRGRVYGFKPLLMALVVYLMTYFGSSSTFSLPLISNFASNYHWLFVQSHVLLFLFCFAGLPLFWFVFYDYIPLNYRPIRYLALIYFIAMSLTAHFSEAWVFQELVLIMYLPVCLAIKRWLVNLPPIKNEQSILDYCNRQAIVFTLCCLTIGYPLLQRFG